MNKKFLSLLLVSAITGTTLISTQSTVNASPLIDPITYSQTAESREIGSFVITAREGANVRSGPGLNYPIVASFANGTVLWRALPDPVTDSTGHKWYKIVLNSTQYAWVSSTTGYAD